MDVQDSATIGQSLGSRAINLDRLEHERFDVLVIGGGITGAGVALDAASRGLKVALVERDDFASGTSSRSSKLVHGGLRYVAQYQFKVTREASEERHRLQRLAPNLVRSVPFILPVFGGLKETAKLTAGLWLYDVLAALRNTHLHRRLTADELHAMVPTLTTTGLDGGFVYYDCRTDDARLTVEVLKAAASFGAVLVNHASVQGFLKEGRRICGVGMTDELGGGSVEVRSRTVVAAVGVWLDSLLRQADHRAQSVVRPAKGVHLVLPAERIGNGGSALTLQTSRDHRITFVIPWMQRTIVGTTDTDYEGDLAQPRATTDDVEYLLEALTRAFPAQDLSVDDVLTVQAGLRPLINIAGTSTANISREDHVLEGESGLISIAGGKLTTYRRMARKVIDLVAKRLTEQHVDRIGPCRTGSIPIGGQADQPMRDLDGLPVDQREHLIHLYGTQAVEVARLAGTSPTLSERLVDDLPQVAAQVVYAVRNEMALTLSDILIRRLRLTSTDRALGMGCVEETADLAQQELDWSEARRDRELQRYRHDAGQFLPPGREAPLLQPTSSSTR